MIPPVAVGSAALALLLDVSDFAARCDLAVTADDAPAGESGEPKQPDQTHRTLTIYMSKLRTADLDRARIGRSEKFERIVRVTIAIAVENRTRRH